MKIGIIGAGAIGATLARALASHGHEVSLANSRGLEAVRAVADAAGATAADVHGAVRGAEAVILAVPFVAVAALPRDLFADLPAAVPVIDAGNYYPGIRDPRIAEIDAGMPESVWVAETLGRPVVKAFNHIEAEQLTGGATPPGTAGRIALAVAGDDAAQKAIAMALIDRIGFDAFDAGALAGSWRQQPNTPIYSTDYPLAEAKQALADAVEGLAAAKRDAFIANAATFWQAHPTPASRTAYFRRYNATRQ